MAARKRLTRPEFEPKQARGLDLISGTAPGTLQRHHEVGVAVDQVANQHIRVETDHSLSPRKPLSAAPSAIPSLISSIANAGRPGC